MKTIEINGMKFEATPERIERIKVTVKECERCIGILIERRQEVNTSEVNEAIESYTNHRNKLLAALATI